jgi:hypothetical protein
MLKRPDEAIPMTRMQGTPNSRRHASGNALLVAVILLLLASVITLLTLNVGLFEQRTSGNDARAKLISEVAEAGIAQGAEYFRLQPTLLQPGSHWARCADLTDKTQFPCGAIADAARRDTMYYWVNGGTNADRNNDGDTDLLDNRMLPLANVVPTAARVNAVGNYTAANAVSVGVGVVLCRIAKPTAAGASTQCTTNLADATNTYVYNYVSVASLPDEGTRTTISQMLGQYVLFQPNLNQPPVIASGSVDVTGGLQIVTNPNGGAQGADDTLMLGEKKGVPVSVWTRKDITKTGTPNTCYIDEFLRFGAKNNDPPTLEDGVIVCDTCGCNGDDSLSYSNSGNKQDEGMDILDIDGSNGANNKGVNADILPQEFPCDLFEYVFGLKARQDDDGDYFCETLVPSVQFTSPSTGGIVYLDADEAYLYKNATKIIPRDASAASLMKPTQVLGVGYPNAAISGIVWCQTNCDLGPNTQIGTPLKPVLLVIDGSARIQGRVFGMVFLRSVPGTPANHPLASMHNHTGDKLNPSNGGTATLDMNAGATIYGAVVVQGEINKANGTAAVIYNADIFKNFANSITPTNSNLPGAWTDRLSY